MPCYDMSCYAMHCTALQYDVIQCNAMRCNMRCIVRKMQSDVKYLIFVFLRHDKDHPIQEVIYTIFPPRPTMFKYLINEEFNTF